MKDEIRAMIRETFPTIPLSDQEELLLQVEAVIQFVDCNYNGLRNLTVLEIALKVKKDAIVKKII